MANVDELYGSEVERRRSRTLPGATPDRLDQLTRLARRLLQAPAAMLCVFEEDGLVRRGDGELTASWGSRRAAGLVEALCRPVLIAGRPLNIEDARVDAKLRKRSAFRDLSVASYVGVPLTLPGGRSPGALCLIDREPGRWGEGDLANLNELAGAFLSEIDARRALAASAEAVEGYRAELQHLGVLRREVSHRVKNSLQITASVLFMQSRTSDDPVVREALEEAQGRVTAVAKVHDRLWRGSDDETLDARDLLEELCAEIAEVVSGLDIGCEGPSVTVSAEDGFNVALLVNELVIIAVKNGMAAQNGSVGNGLRDEHARKVTVSLAKPRVGQATLEVRDEGHGLPTGSGPASGRSFGLEIIGAVTRQLDGVVSWDDAPERVCVTFPDRIG